MPQNDIDSFLESIAQQDREEEKPAPAPGGDDGLGDFLAGIDYSDEPAPEREPSTGLQWMAEQFMSGLSNEASAVTEFVGATDTADYLRENYGSLGDEVDWSFGGMGAGLLQGLGSVAPYVAVGAATGGVGGLVGGMTAGVRALSGAARIAKLAGIVRKSQTAGNLIYGASSGAGYGKYDVRSARDQGEDVSFLEALGHVTTRAGINAAGAAIPVGTTKALRGLIPGQGGKAAADVAANRAIRQGQSRLGRIGRGVRSGAIEEGNRGRAAGGWRERFAPCVH